MTDTTYQGWTNYETWNVALYINNEFPIYSLACEWVKYQKEEGLPVKYDTFRHTLSELFGKKTMDGVDWNDTVIDDTELDEMLMELVD